MSDVILLISELAVLKNRCINSRSAPKAWPCKCLTQYLSRRKNSLNPDFQRNTKTRKSIWTGSLSIWHLAWFLRSLGFHELVCHVVTWQVYKCWACRTPRGFGCLSGRDYNTAQVKKRHGNSCVAVNSSFLSREFWYCQEESGSFWG